MNIIIAQYPDGIGASRKTKRTYRVMNVDNVWGSNRGLHAEDDGWIEVTTEVRDITLVLRGPETDRDIHLGDAADVDENDEPIDQYVINIATATEAQLNDEEA